MSYSLHIYQDGLPKQFMDFYPAEIPEVTSGSMNELMRVLCQKNSFAPLMKTRHVHEGTISNDIIALDIARLFTGYYRQNTKDETNHFQAEESWLKRSLVGETFLTCDADESIELRRILIDFLKEVKDEDLLRLCHKTFNEYTAHWEGKINLTEEIPRIIAKVGAIGIMGFEKMSDSIAKEMGVLAQGQPKQTHWYDKLWVHCKNSVTLFKIYWAVRTEVVTQIAQENQHSFLAKLSKHARKKFGIAVNAPLTWRATHFIIMNYLAVLFAFQVTTTSLLKDFLWQIALKEELQTELRNICDELQVSLEENGPKKYCKELFEKFNPYLLETLRKFPPAGWVRKMRYDATILKHEKDNQEGKIIAVLLKGDEVRYIPFIAGRNPEYYPNPENFDIHRFKKNVDGTTVAKKHMEYFGSFKHICPGREYAIKEVKKLAELFLRTFRFTTPLKTANYNVNHVLGTDEPIFVEVTRINRG